MLDELKGNFPPPSVSHILYVSSVNKFFFRFYIRSTVRMGRDYLELASKVGRPSGYNTWGCKVTSSLAGHCEIRLSSRSLNTSTHTIKRSLWDVLAVLLLPGLIQFWRPWLLFQVPEFFDSSFLQVKVSSGLHRSPDGPQGCWTTEATPAFVQRTVLGTVPKRSLVHSGVKSADSQTLEGDVYLTCFWGKAL